MSEFKRFSGMMDTDSKEDFIAPSSHKYARNLRFYGTQQGLRAENIKGNVLVPNSDLPSGLNKCNGAFFDQVKQRILWFNYNGNGNHGLFKYSIQTGLTTRLFQCGVNSATDILDLSLDYPVHSAAIIYRPESDGDLFYCTDGLNRPRCINLDTIASLSPFTEDMINAGKNAPYRRPSVSYADDTNTNVNNLRRQLFRFIYRWGYANLEKSTWSPISILPLPVDGYTPDTQNSSTLNNNIEVILFAGGSDSVSIELAVQVCNGTTWSDFFSVDTFDMDEYGISANGSYTYSFYNDGAYTPVTGLYINENPAEGALYYSYLPDKANTLELLNGNVIIYGGVTDGYPQMSRSDIDVNVTTGSTNPNIPSISFQYTGGSSIVASIGSVITTGAIYHVEFDYISGGVPGSSSINYVTPLGATTSSIATAIAALLNGGVVQATPSSGTFAVTILGLSPSISNVLMTVSITGSESAGASWPWSCNEQLALIYFDDRMKPVATVSFTTASVDTTDFAVTTPDFSTNSNVPQVPFLAATINHTPPVGATTFQWLRANKKPTFIQWITNDYQTDTDFLYFCIQNLNYTQSRINGYVPSYEFTKGDRVRVMAKYNSGSGILTPFDLQLDMEILGEEDRIMTSPASTGRFLKVARPITFPSVAYGANEFIQIYTPQFNLDTDDQLYYEWGQQYSIFTSGGNRFHEGQIQNQSLTQPATFQWFDGDVYYKNRTFYLNVNDAVATVVFMMDANYSDYFSSAVNSNGRGWTIDPDADTIYRPTQARWGRSYIQDTNINELNIFYPNDFDTYDLSRGAIIRFKARDRILRIFQERGCGQVGIYSKFIQDNSGTNTLTTTDEIITTNNIQYYQGNYGIGSYPTNLCSSTIADYFSDVVSGREIRLSYDGMTDLGLLYKGQFTLPGYITPYNKTLLQSNGSTAKIIKFWDTFEGEAHTLTQAGTANGVTAQNVHYSFNEVRNSFCTFYDYIYEWALSGNDIIFSWSSGQLYIHNSSTYCNFYGTQYGAIIQLVFNQNLLEKKTWMSINQVSDSRWPCSEIYTSTKSYGTQRQQSSLVSQELTMLEGNASAAFRRDSNSSGGRMNGQFLKGNYLVATLRINSTPDLVFLSEVSVLTKNSPLTVLK